MTTLVVGCPIRAREWILPSWFAHVEKACTHVDLIPEYLFVIDTHDVEAEVILRGLAAAKGRLVRVVRVDEGGDRMDRRVWNEERYHHMVFLRNRMLQTVREISPDYFLSLDSDILIAESVLSNLVDSAENFDAVGGKLYMTEGGTGYPSYANLVNSAGLSRVDFDGVTSVDVIMAMKLMNPSAYSTDYRFHFQGEDIGWSLACTEKKLKLGWDGRVCSKHVMQRDQLEPVDKRCGY